MEFLPLCFEFLSPIWRNRKVSQCRCGKEALYLTINGQLKTCGPNNKILFSLKKNYNPSEIIPKIIEISKKFDFLPGECNGCKYWTICKKSCHAIYTTYNTSIERRHPLCPLQKKKKILHYQ